MLALCTALLGVIFLGAFRWPMWVRILGGTVSLTLLALELIAVAVAFAAPIRCDRDDACPAGMYCSFVSTQCEDR